MRFKLTRILGLVCAVIGSSALAGEIVVVDPYVRLVPQGVPTTGAFMLIRNTGSTDRKLLRIDSPIARSVELHNHINDNGVMRMRPVKEIELKAKGQAELKPGSYHVMLIDLTKVLQEGEKVPMTLLFDDGSSEKIDVAVKKPAASK